MNRLHLWLAMSVWLASGPVSAREWVDASGQHRVEAELIGIDFDGVRLRKSTGETITLRTEALSAADRAFLDTTKAEIVQVRQILDRHCHSCHGDNGSDEGGMNYVLNLRRLAESGKVMAKAPAKSSLLQRIRQGEMPPEGTSPRPSDSEMATLQRWIESGAPYSVEQTARTFLSQDQVMELIQKDLQAAPERNRRFLRYFTITHLYNTGVSDDELETFRLALTKLVNSLSWEAQLVTPQAIDKEKTVFRVDIRDLRWSANTWDALCKAYPYGVRVAGYASQYCSEATGSELAALRADWFVAVASRPPLYHQLLELPDSLSGLQSLLHIDFGQNVRQDRVVRAGFSKSGISVNPRIIERHHISGGACWVSYDFAGGSGDRNFFNTPLDFHHDGGEVIFNLPNGLQAYLLVDGDGKRIDKAPTTIVKDTLQTDSAVLNGISCIRCHASGIISKTDDVRKHVEANPQAFARQKDEILALYAPADKMQALMDSDRERFQKALQSLGLKRFTERSEPINNTTKRFAEPLVIERAAAEMGVPTDRLLSALEKHVSVQKLIGPLRVPGATVPRDAFDDAFGSLVSELHVGTFLPPTAKLATGSPGDPFSTASSTPDSAKPADDNRSKTTAKRAKLARLGSKGGSWPTALQISSQVRATPNGVEFAGRNYARSKTGDYLKRNFVCEVVFELKKEARGNGIVFIGIGEGVPGTPNDEPKNSLNFRIHPPDIAEGLVDYAKGREREKAGELSSYGPHRAIIEKQGNSVTFAIDVDNDGPSSDDIEFTIPDVTAVTSTLHEKNTYVFFGGGGVFKEFGVQNLPK